MDSNSPIERTLTYREHPAYLLRECGGSARSSLVGEDGCFGMRWFHGPLCFERFTSEREPTIVLDGQRRLTVWQTIARADRPTGWWRGLPKMSIGLTGYAAIHKDGSYEREWSSHARRHLARWRRDSSWTVHSLSVEEYLAAYGRSTQDPILRLMFSNILKEKIRTHVGLVRIIGASRDGGAPEAGFVCVDVPETGESLHLMSFICRSARTTSVAIGLMDHWFVTSAAAGIRFLDFGLFWQKGDPRDWKGFSRFKSQLGVRYLRFPTPLMKLTLKSR